jgi:hypothetical protein
MAKTREMAAPRQGNALVPRPPGPVDEVTVSPAARAFLDEVKGRREAPRRVPLVTIRHQEAVFLLPTGETADAVEGYPVYYYSTRRFYAKPPVEGQSSPPDCWSADMVVPDPAARDKQAARCAECPKSQWGTARDGKSQACAQQLFLFLLNPSFGAPVPVVAVVFPPSSLKTLLGNRTAPGYIGQAASRHGVYEIVWTRFELEARGGPVKYAVVRPVMGEPARDLEEIRRIARARDAFEELFESMRGATAEVEPAATADDDS